MLADAQIFVLMSNYEGMPRSILEAMRAGLPVIASRTAGIPEIVVDGVTGLVVEPHDVDGLVAALSRLFDDAGLRARIGQAGRKSFEARYELGRLVTDMLDLYSEVVGRSVNSSHP
jgi:glycosyltransferase involved in cell wall biosynthesis